MARWMVTMAALALVTTGCETEAPVDEDTTADVTTQDTTSDGDAAGPDGTGDAEQDTTPKSCNPILDEGCGADEKCSYEGGSADTPSCVAKGDKLFGQECAGIGDCAEGICLSLNDTGNRCYKFCKTEIHCDVQVGTDALGFKGSCADLQDSTYDVCELDVEYETCDLLEQGCADGKGCYVTGEPTPVCLPPGTAAKDDGCDGAGDCSPGLVCINKICKQICDPSAQEPCGDAFTPCANYAGAGYCDD